MTLNFIPFTIRAFKIACLEDRQEDFGQTATYKGSVAESPNAFTLDESYVFKAGKSVPVSGNTALMLSETRFADHFEINGEMSVHYGLFSHQLDASESCCVTNIGSCC